MKWLSRRGAKKACGSRWLVVDVESSGLRPRTDRLLAIAAIALRHEGERLRICLGDSFEVVLGHPDAATDKDNILVHGIGVGAQRAGVEPARALREFEVFAADSPLIAFHAAFDRTLIDRAARTAIGRGIANPWLDLADLAPVLRPASKAHALDEWLAEYAIECSARHQAAADTLATAELLLKLWPLALAQGGAEGFRALAALARSRRWLQTGGHA